MKAEIVEGFGQEILSKEGGDEFDYFTQISELKECTNVVIGKRLSKGCYEALVGDLICQLEEIHRNGACFIAVY